MNLSASTGKKEKEVNSIKILINVFLGRAGQANILIMDAEETISRRHASIYAVDACVYIRDLASSNGTYVNEVKLNAPQQLFYKDSIRLGECRPIRVQHH